MLQGGCGSSQKCVYVRVCNLLFLFFSIVVPSAATIIIVVCVGFLALLVILGILRIHSLHRQGMGQEVPEAAAEGHTGTGSKESDLFWDDSALTIIVNPMEVRSSHRNQGWGGTARLPEPFSYDSLISPVLPGPSREGCRKLWGQSRWGHGRRRWQQWFGHSWLPRQQWHGWSAHHWQKWQCSPLLAALKHLSSGSSETYSWEEEVSLTSFFPHLVHVLLPHVIFASHAPSSSAIFIVDIPYDWPLPPPPVFGSLETHIWALAHDCGTVQTMMKKEGLGKKRNVERGASHMAQSRVSHNPSPDIIYIYIYIVYFFNVVVWGLFSFHAKQNNPKKKEKNPHNQNTAACATL